MKPPISILAFVLLVPLATLQAAELRITKIFTDHCVLQLEMPDRGWAE